jgi:ABC-2 type transport system permease protein
MNRSLRLVQVHIWRSFLQWLAWRAFLITLVIEQIAIPLLGFAVWSAALPDSTTISTYYVALLVVQMMTVSYEHHTVSNGIYDGTFAHTLLLPQAPVLVTIGTNLAMRIWHLLLALPVIFAAILITGATFKPGSLLAAFPAMILAAALRFLFTYSLALTAFWTQQAHGTVIFGEVMIFLLGGSAAPIALFPDRLRTIGELLPFRAMLGFPAEIASGNLDAASIFTGYAWQCGWLLAFFAVTRMVWIRGVRHYVAIGG